MLLKRDESESVSIALLVSLSSLVGLEILLAKSCWDIQWESLEEQDPGLVGWQGSQVPMGFYNNAGRHRATWWSTFIV